MKILCSNEASVRHIDKHGHCLDYGIGLQPGPDSTVSVKETTVGQPIETFIYVTIRKGGGDIKVNSSRANRKWKEDIRPCLILGL